MSILSSVASAEPRVVTIPGKSPIVSFRVVFLTGAAADPADKPGLASLTATMMTDGGTRDMTYKQVVDALFPMAARVSSEVDKEMVTISGATHVDNLEAYYKIFRAMILTPGWRADDFTRLRDDEVNYLRVSLRQANDEELGKEALYEQIYRGTPYGHINNGKVSALEKMSVDDLKSFYQSHFTRNNVIIGLAGGYPPGFVERVRADFAKNLPAASAPDPAAVSPAPITGRNLTIIDKQTRSVAYSVGFPIDVKRGDPDFPALLVASTYFGQHRMSLGRLYQRIRELRGINYGDYSYIEYFPRGMYQFEPEPNLARQSQIFQIWIRPVEPPTAVFALRLALYELDNLVNDGLSQQDFEDARSYALKNVNLLLKTGRAQLGYAIDSAYYHIPEYHQYLHDSLTKLTRSDVNRAIRKRFQTKDLDIVAVSSNGEELKKKLLSGEPSPMTYNSPKAKEVVEEDKIVEKYPLAIDPDRVTILPVDTVFE